MMNCKAIVAAILMVLCLSAANSADRVQQAEPDTNRPAVNKNTQPAVIAPSKLQQKQPALKVPSRVPQKANKVGNVIQVRQGDSIAFLVQGRQYSALDRVRVIRFQASTKRGASSRPTSSLRATISNSTRQGRWIEVRTLRSTPYGRYWVEGWAGKSKDSSMALPAVIEVVSAKQRIQQRAGLPAKINFRQINSDTYRAQDGQMVATRPLAGNTLVPYDPVCEFSSDIMQEVLEQGGSMPCAQNAATGGSANTTYLLSHSPSDVGEPGETLSIIGQNLPAAGSIRVTLAGQQLEIASATPSLLRVTLPSAPTTGALIVDLSNGDVLGILNNAYQVVAPPGPDTRLFADFTGTQTSVSWKLGYQMSMLSWLAYFDDLGDFLEDNTTFADQLGVTVTKEFDVTKYGLDVCHVASGSMQGVVFEHQASNSVIVSIRGSQTGNAAQDWWDNDLDSQPFPRIGWAAGTTIHCGFHQAAKVVYDELAEDLQDYAAAGKKIWLTGHSLGGASAVLLAAMLEWDANVNVAGVYSFGGPGVGNAVFINVYDDDIPNTHRYEFQHDPAVSLNFPLHGRPGKNHLLHSDGSTDQNADTGYLAYIGVKPISDLMVTHMEYWCRIYAELDESSAQDMSAWLIVPPSNPDGSGVCDVNNFYGNL